MPAPLDESDPRLPPALHRDLRRVFGTEVRVPASIDDALAAAARRRLRSLRSRPWLWVAAAAAAALLVLVPVLAWPPRTPAGVAVAREDFDRNGRVDVLDAFRLSLALRRGESVSPELDLDHDGRIDAGDVDRIAVRAVAIRG